MRGGEGPPLPPNPPRRVKLYEYFLFSPMSDKRRVTPVTPHTGTNFNSYVFTNAQISTMQSNEEFIAEMVRRMEEDKAKKVINMQEEEAPLVPLSNTGSDTEPLLNDDDIEYDADATLPMSNSWNLLDSDNDLPKLLDMRGMVMGNINIPQAEECDSDGLFSDEEEEKPKRERVVYTESEDEKPAKKAKGRGSLMKRYLFTWNTNMPVFYALVHRTLRHHFNRLHTISSNLRITIVRLMIHHEFHENASN